MTNPPDLGASSFGVEAAGGGFLTGGGASSLAFSAPLVHPMGGGGGAGGIFPFAGGMNVVEGVDESDSAVMVGLTLKEDGEVLDVAVEFNDGGGIEFLLCTAVASTVGGPGGGGGRCAHGAFWGAPGTISPLTVGARPPETVGFVPVVILVTPIGTELIGASGKAGGAETGVAILGGNGIVGATGGVGAETGAGDAEERTIFPVVVEVTAAANPPDELKDALPPAGII